LTVCLSAAAVGTTPPSPAGAMPGEVLEKLVPLVGGEIGEERRTDCAGDVLVGFARHAIAAQAHGLGVRHGQASLNWWRTWGDGFLTASFSSLFKYAVEMPAARDASIADSPRTSRACLSMVPSEGAIMRLSYNVKEEPHLPLPRSRGLLEARHWPEPRLAAPLLRMPNGAGRNVWQSIKSTGRSSPKDPGWSRVRKRYGRAVLASRATTLDV